MKKESKVPINESQFGKLDYKWWKSIFYKEFLKTATTPKGKRKNVFDEKD